jgi:hypothetical protein
MSRTDKDVPHKVIEQKMLQQGRVHDNHERLGLTREGYRDSRALAATFNKGDAKAINEYRAYLSTVDNITVEEVSGGGRNGYRYSGVYGAPLERVYEPKTITFEVKEKYTVKYTSYCTDAEHYDAETNTDTRDGGRVVCYTEYANHHGEAFSTQGCGCCEPIDRSVSPTKQRSVVISAVKAFNSGMSMEELEEMYNDVL